MRTNKGFTLIELLVVIAIIGILSSVVLVSLNTARQKARDAQRISDVRQIQLALEFYYDAADPNSYPVMVAGDATPASVVGAALAPTYLPVMPTEPVSGGNPYRYEGSATTYCIGVNLEVTPTPPNNSSTCVGNLGTTVNYAVAP